LKKILNENKLKLKAIVEGEDFFKEAPTLEEGLELFDYKNSIGNAANAGNSQYEPM